MRSRSWHGPSTGSPIGIPLPLSTISGLAPQSLSSSSTWLLSSSSSLAHRTSSSIDMSCPLIVTSTAPKTRQGFTAMR